MNNTARNKKNVIEALNSEGGAEIELKYGGKLYLDNDRPFLIIYRKSSNDKEMIQLAESTGSYLIIENGNFEYFHSMVKNISKKMSTRFGSFIFIEIYSGPLESSEFVIRGPAHKLPISLKVLQKELQKIKNEKRQNNILNVRIEQTKSRLNSQKAGFFSIDELKNLGCTFIGLEIPPIYMKSNGATYPIVFENLKKGFIAALQKSIFEFVRVQTPSDINSYAALRKRKIHDKLFEIDQQLTAIENAYQFLLLVAPVNVQSIRKTFFESKYEIIPPFHYRLLPIDPDLLKRKLYNLRIEEIDDPALAFLYGEKREEIDQELTMLKERDTKKFLFRSLRLYKGVKKNILYEAKLVLNTLEENVHQEKTKEVNADDFQKMAEKEFNYFREQRPDFKSRVHIRKDVNIIMVSRGELYVPADYTMTKNKAQGIIQHEIGTHVLTFYNGKQQPLTQLSQGFAGYDSLQEGLAVLSEYLVGGLSGNRLRLVAGRVVAGDALLNDASFKEVFHLLHYTYGFSKHPAFNITSRIFQGGGFLKDIVYLRGLVQLRDYLQEGGNFDILLSGKFALEHVSLIRQLIERKILKPAQLKPSYYENKDFKKRMKKLRDGLALSKMV